MENSNTNVGQTVLFEDDHIKVWHISLAPGEVLPAHTHTHDYTWVARTAGSAESTYTQTNKTKQLSYQKGDNFYYDHAKNGDFTHDLRNTGNAPLVFVTTEFKK